MSSKSLRNHRAIVLVLKPNWTLCFCNDFRKPNKVSKFGAYLIPQVVELIERLRLAQYITSLDFTKGYWYIALTKEAREKTSFFTSEDHFQNKILQFRLLFRGQWIEHYARTRNTAQCICMIITGSTNWEH